jgi:TctA family transporter
VLGIVLGPLVENNFMTTMIKADGNLLGFFSRPIAAVLGVITLLIWAWVIVGWLLRAVWRASRLQPAEPDRAARAVVETDPR